MRAAILPKQIDHAKQREPMGAVFVNRTSDGFFFEARLFLAMYANIYIYIYIYIGIYIYMPMYFSSKTSKGRNQSTCGARLLPVSSVCHSQTSVRLFFSTFRVVVLNPVFLVWGSFPRKRDKGFRVAWHGRSF